MIRVWILAALLLGGLPAAADAQIFLASRPRPEFEIGPLFVRASIAPGLGPTPVDIFFSLAVPPTRSAADLEQDIFLLWPGEVGRGSRAVPADPRLARYVTERGYTVIEEGRLPLFAQALYETGGTTSREEMSGGAPFVTFVRDGGPLGLTSPVTYIRIPWTPILVNRAKLVDLRLTLDRLVKPKRQTWVEKTFWGPRHRIALTFNDVHGRALFPLYFENRDRMIRLGEDLAEILINFAEVDHLKIDQISPPTANRKLSETRESTDVVSLFVDRSEGVTPRVLSVEFGYFSGLRSWAPVLIPILFFALGNLAGPLLKALAQRIGRALSGRLHIGRGAEGNDVRDTGVVLSREAVARIVPGETTREELVRICGPNAEEFEQLGAPDRRTLIYRGRRVVPRRRRTFGWLATVSHWDVEHHEVEVELEHDRVRDVHARVRRSRLAHPATA